MSGPDGFKNRSKKKGEDLEQYLESRFTTQKCVCLHWRLASHALASNTNKKARHIIEDATCTMCDLEPEYVAHAVARCPQVSALLTKNPTQVGYARNLPIALHGSRVVSARP